MADMDEYVKKLDLIDAIYDHEFANWCDKDEVSTIINDMPSVDVVEVIRCAECKWFQCNMSMDGYLPDGVDEFECRHWCGSCDPVDFCSFAERRQE